MILQCLEGSCVPSKRAQGRMLAWRPVLRIGNSGEDVYELQVWLQESGYLGEAPDGKYGILTEEAVQQLQRDYGLTPDGVVGSKTRKLIRTGKVFKNRLVHTVKEGESLSDISDLYGVEEKTVIRSNRLSNACKLWEGQRIAILKRTIMGMVSPDDRNGDVDTFLNANQQLLDAVIASSVHVNEDGTITTKNVDYSGMEAGVVLRVSVATGESSRQDMMRKLLLDKDLCQVFTANCVELVKKSRCGLCFDFWVTDEDTCVAFAKLLSLLRKTLGPDIPLGLLLPAQTAIHISMRNLVHIGSLVDWISVGMPVETCTVSSSYEDMRQALSRLVTWIPRWKIMLTITGYGVHSACGRHNFVRRITVCEAEKLAYRYGTEACWDEKTRAYTFGYRSRRTEYSVWYRGVRGLRAGCALVNKYNIGGVMVCYIDAVSDEFWNTVGLHFVSNRNVPLSNDSALC